MNSHDSDLVSRFKSSGKTQQAFCEANGVPLETLRYYLYKKNKHKSSKSSTPKDNCTSPAFISFNRPGTTSTDSRKHHVTVISGNFTLSELAKLITGMEAVAC
jgi:hypothetical protein